MILHGSPLLAISLASVLEAAQSKLCQGVVKQTNMCRNMQGCPSLIFVLFYQTSQARSLTWLNPNVADKFSVLWL